MVSLEPVLTYAALGTSGCFGTSFVGSLFDCDFNEEWLAFVQTRNLTPSDMS